MLTKKQDRIDITCYTKLTIDHFGQNRFIPSEQAIHSINALQSTEWAVNLEMVDIARSTIKNHVKAEILSKLKN